MGLVSVETTRSRSETVQVAQTILRQIGAGNLMAVGAREKVVTPGGVRFKVGRAMLYMEVVLDSSDTYTVTLTRVRKFVATVVETADNVYAEDVGQVVYRMVNK